LNNSILSRRFNVCSWVGGVSERAGRADSNNVSDDISVFWCCDVSWGGLGSCDGGREQRAERAERGEAATLRKNVAPEI